MAETNEQRITQLESIVNELTARVAADPENMDLPPLLAAAKAELLDLQAAEVAAAEKAAAEVAAAEVAAAEKAAAEVAAAEKAAAEVAAAEKAAAAAAAANKAAADAKAVADAKAAAAAAPAATPAPARATSFRTAAIAIKPLPPTVPESMKAGARPSPAARRPAPVAGTSRSGH